MVLKLIAADDMPGLYEVSIPNRDYMVLKQLLYTYVGSEASVSIPNRDYMVLKLLAVKALSCLVFKVQLRQPIAKIAFQTLGCQEQGEEKSLKIIHSKGLKSCVNLKTSQICSKLDRARDSGRKFEVVKKTPTG